MNQDKIITINTKLDFKDIIANVLDNDPQSECEFNNLLIYNLINEYIEKLQAQLNQQRAGKRKKRKTKAKKQQKNRTRRHKLIQKGGADPRIVLFFMALFIITFVEGVQNMTDIKVIDRIKQTSQVSELFRNNYGTCAVNTLLFLKTIDLPTFADLSISKIVQGQGITKHSMKEYLNKELNVNSRWYTFNGFNLSEEDAIDAFIETLREKLISLRLIYGFPSNQAIITALNYPIKNKYTGHSVTVWLTSNNEVVIIDPQTFVKKGIILYTSETSFDSYMFNDRELKRGSLRKYIKDKIDVTNENRDIDIFESIHLELEDISGSESLTLTNKRLVEVISRIKEAEEKMKEGDL